MWRIGIGLLVGGGLLTYFGISELIDGSGVSAEPVPVSMADLQAGKDVPDRHLKIDSHAAVYNGCYAFYDADPGDNSTIIPPDAKLHQTYYPIVSVDELHRFEDAIRDNGGEFPPGLQIKVFAIVRCSKFSRGRDLPDNVEVHPEVVGMVKSSLSSEDSEAVAAMRTFPEFSLASNVIMIEEGDGPWGFIPCALMILGGLALIAGGIGFFAVTMFTSN